MSRARNADRFALYEHAVQSPKEEVDFITRAFKKLRGRKPLSMREDFCGTGIFAAEWVHSDRRRTATGVDLDGPTLKYARDKHLARLPRHAAERVKLLQRDVRSAIPGPFDCACAYNYSWWIFKQSAELVKYFRSVRASLKKDGVFFLDAFGGVTSMGVSLEPRRYRGFTYVWEQASFNPINNDLQCYIHFQFKDGSRIERAFSYDWRHYSLIEAREHLLAAGFSKVTVYWEDDSGYFKPRTVVEDEPSWNVYIVAER